MQDSSLGSGLEALGSEMIVGLAILLVGIPVDHLLFLQRFSGFKVQILGMNGLAAPLGGLNTIMHNVPTLVVTPLVFHFRNEREGGDKFLFGIGEEGHVDSFVLCQKRHCS